MGNQFQVAGDGSIISGRDTIIESLTVIVNNNQLPVPPDEPVPHDASIRFGLPPCPPNLYGRASEVEELESLLRDTGNAESGLDPIYLCGPPGIGKTATASWICYTSLERYSLVWWVEAGSQSLIAEQYVQFARAIGYGGTEDTLEAKRTVDSYLAERGNWLVVFDNASGFEEIRPMLPRRTSGTGAAVVTTREAPVASLRCLDLGRLHPQHAAEWLQHATASDDSESAHRLAQEVDHFPLALTAIAAFCEENGTPLARYLDLLETELEAPDIVPDSVTATFTLALAEIAERDTNGGAIALLRLCSFLAPDRIPLALFTPDDLGVDTAVDIERSIGLLRSFSLVKRDGQWLWMHRILQDFVRSQLRLLAD